LPAGDVEVLIRSPWGFLARGATSPCTRGSGMRAPWAPRGAVVPGHLRGYLHRAKERSGRARQV